MKKRSAIVIAGGLVAALLAGSAALSLGLLGASSASPAGDRTAPRVRTIERTVTIHKKDKSAAGAITFVVAAPTSQSSAAAGDDESGSEFEGDGGSFGSHGESEGSEGD